MTLGLIIFFWWQRLPAEYDGEPALQDQPYYYPFFAIMFAVLAVSLGFSKGLWKLYDNAFFTFTAKYSFGIYLWHMLVFDWIARSWRCFSHASVTRSRSTIPSRPTCAWPSGVSSRVRTSWR